MFGVTSIYIVDDSVEIKMSGYEKMHLTLMLVVLADDTKFLLDVILNL